MTALATASVYNTKLLTILRRIESKDQTAVKDCFDTYGNFIWALVRKLTASTEEAEAAAQEIFIDIWRYAERGVEIRHAEKFVIAMIARQRLIKHLQ